MQHKIAKCKRHALHFAREALNKPVEAMLSVDPRLRDLANLGLPNLVDPYFDFSDDSSSDHSDDEDGPHNLASRPSASTSSTPPQAIGLVEF
jgi:hypothetical protein